MTKAEMMDELDDVFTDRRLTRGAVERALADGGSRTRHAARFLPRPRPRVAAPASAGCSCSTEPAAVQFFGSLTRGLVARLEAMGGPPPGGLPIAMVAAGSPVHATGIAAPLCEGERGAAVQVPRRAGHAAAARDRRAAQRAAGPRALRLSLGAGPARRGAAGRPPADLADGRHQHQRDLHPRAARGDLGRVRGAADRQLRVHGGAGRRERAGRRT